MDAPSRGRTDSDIASLGRTRDQSASVPPESQAVARAATRWFLHVHAAELLALQQGEQAAGSYSAWLSLAMDELDSDAPGEAA